MSPEQLKVAQLSVEHLWSYGRVRATVGNIMSCGRRHHNHGVWLSLVRDGLAQMMAPTFGEPERFQLTKDGLDAVLAANGAKPS